MYKIRREGNDVKISEGNSDVGAFIADVKDYAYGELVNIVNLANDADMLKDELEKLRAENKAMRAMIKNYPRVVRAAAKNKYNG